jgi:hypothetical protein
MVVISPSLPQGQIWPYKRCLVQADIFVSQTGSLRFAFLATILRRVKVAAVAEPSMSLLETTLCQAVSLAGVFLRTVD